jgi:hypothetical protein
VLDVYNSAANTLLSGSYALKFYESGHFDSTTDGIAYNINANDLRDKIAYYCGYDNSIVRENLDNTGSVTASNSFAGYRYTITIKTTR